MQVPYIPLGHLQPDQILARRDRRYKTSRGIQTQCGIPHPMRTMG